MKVLVFGATGLTGQRVMECGLAHEQQITAYVRSPKKLQIQSRALRILKGTLQDESALCEATYGQQAVISTLGARTLVKRSPDLVEGLRNIVRAMKAGGVERLVYMSALGVGDSRTDAQFFQRTLMFPLLLKHVFEDHEANEQILRESGLRWTIVRPSVLTNGPARGGYRSGPHIKDRFPVGRISRSAVAEFLLQEAGEDRYVREAVNLTS